MHERVRHSSLQQTQSSGAMASYLTVSIDVITCYPDTHSQASKALHELRLLYSEEVKRRTNAENEADALRQRTALGQANALGKDGGSVEKFGRGGSSGAVFGTKPTRTDRSDTLGGDGNSPIGRFKQRFFDARGVRRASPAVTVTATMASLSRQARPGDERGNVPQELLNAAGKAPVQGSPQGICSSFGKAASGLSAGLTLNEKQCHPEGDRGQNPRVKALREAGGAAAVASAASGGGARPSMSFSGPPPVQPAGYGEGRKPDTPRISLAQPQIASPARLPGNAGEQRPRQGVPIMPPRPETPGRPVRPAWQDGGRMRIGTGAGGGGMTQVVRPGTPLSGQKLSPLAQHQQRQRLQQQQRGRPQVPRRRIWAVYCSWHLTCMIRRARRVHVRCLFCETRAAGQIAAQLVLVFTFGLL